MKLKNILKGIILGTLMPLAILTGVFLSSDIQKQYDTFFTEEE